MTLILSFQMITLILFYQYGGVVSTMQSNAVRIFSEKTKHSQLNMERELMMYWMNSIQDRDDIPDTVEMVLRERGCTASDITSDPELNSAIVSALTGKLIDLLHYSFGNGVYAVLDGPASVNGNKEEKAGIFIRDLDANSYAQDRSDLLMERGLPSIAKKYGIALDSFWELGFRLDQMEARDFYEKPFTIAKSKRVQQKNAKGCAYLGIMRPKEVNKESLSYSIPIILSDDTVVGVIGGEIDATRIRRYLNDNMDENDSNITLLAKNYGEQDSFIPVVSDRVYNEHRFQNGQEIPYEESEWESVHIVKDEKGATWYAAVEPLKIYSGNTPFANENWMLIRLTPEKALFRNINEIRKMLMLSAFFSLILGLIAMVLASHIFTGPIRRLMKEMREIDLNRRQSLKKVHIQEIDELVDEVNRLNTDVVEHASKVSHILDALDMEIGVFEYEPDAKEVFCSYSLLRMLGVDCEEGVYQFMEKDQFRSSISRLQNPVEDEQAKIYELYNKQEKHYMRLKLMENENHEIIGVLMDVTSEINNQKRLEHERDCDLLTGLYNRGGFKERAQKILNEAETAAVVMWDMDNLKYVNDTYGHEVGDAYICMFAEYLRGLQKDGAIIGRRSGDEFMAVIYNDGKKEQWKRIRISMEQLNKVVLEAPDGSSIPLRASAGVAWYPYHGKTLADLVRYADFAMYMSKHSYKGIVQEFDAETYETNAYLLSGREELNQILESRDVLFALQPIIARDGQIYGYEALMRPKLKKLKNISELLHLTKLQAKLPQFEELTWFGVMEWIDKRQQYLAEGSRIFINSIANVSLSSEIIRQLEERYEGLLNRIVLELTETEQSDNVCLETKISVIHRWNALFALDDYGTGYSNDATLLKINPNIVKMDQELVRGIHENPNQQLVAKHLVDYCHSRQILILGEGVETEEELRYLMGIGVDLFQGYYLARPNIEIQPPDPAVIQKMLEMEGK